MTQVIEKNYIEKQLLHAAETPETPYWEWARFDVTEIWGIHPGTFAYDTKWISTVDHFTAIILEGFLWFARFFIEDLTRNMVWW